METIVTSCHCNILHFKQFITKRCLTEMFRCVNKMFVSTFFKHFGIKSFQIFDTVNSLKLRGEYKVFFIGSTWATSLAQVRIALPNCKITRTLLGVALCFATAAWKSLLACGRENTDYIYYLGEHWPFKKLNY